MIKACKGIIDSSPSPSPGPSAGPDPSPSSNSNPNSSPNPKPSPSPSLSSTQVYKGYYRPDGVPPTMSLVSSDGCQPHQPG